MEALAWCEAGEAFDVAILDAQMPEVDGIELGRRLTGPTIEALLEELRRSSHASLS